jgi:hypothetical protein
MTEIQIHSERFTVQNYRRNYKRCRSCHTRTGTVILSTQPVPVTFYRHRFDNRPAIEEVRLLVICETCGRRWVPTTRLTLRALGVHS